MLEEFVFNPVNALVDGIASEQVIFQDLACPDSKLGAAPGVDPITC